MDGVEIGTSEVKSTGRSQTYIIERQSHGAHTLEIYAEMTISDVTVRSNKLHLEILWVATDSSEPIISFIANVDSATQGETINVPYMIYDPSTEVANLTLSVIDEDGDLNCFSVFSILTSNLYRIRPSIPTVIRVSAVSIFG